MNNILFLISVYEDLFLEYININQDTLCNSYGIAYGKNKKTEAGEYKKVIFYSDYLKNIPSISEDDMLALQKIEIISQISLADCIHSDRHLTKLKRQDRKNIAYRILLDAITMIEEHKINYIFSEGADDYISFALSKYFEKSTKVKFLYAIPSRIGATYHFSDNIDNAPIGYLKRFALNLSNKEFASTEMFISDYISKKGQPYYINSNLRYKFLTWQQFQSFLRYSLKFITEKHSFHIRESPLSLIMTKCLKIIRKILYNYVPSIDDLNLPGKFIIFPLQFSPEAATLVQGSKFHNMYQVIELISKSLPVNVTLIVKEHKLCVGRREYQFFKKINNLHNVEFIKENADTYNLIKRSSGVITISSSMALEALMLKKPVGIIGKVYYDNLSNVFNFHNFYTLDQDIQTMLSSEHDPDEVNALIQTILDCKFDVDMHPESYSKIENLPEISHYISKFS